MSELVIDAIPEKRGARTRAGAQGMGRFVLLLGEIRAWMAANEARVAKVYLVPDGRHLRMYAVGTSATFDPELTRAVAQLMIDLARRGVTLVGSEVPDGTPDELAAFFDPAEALVLTRR